MSGPNFTIDLIQLLKTDLQDPKNTFAGKSQLMDKLSQQTIYLENQVFDLAEKGEINRIFQNHKIILRLA